MSTIFNEMSMMILKEGKKADCCDEYECDACCQDFQDTLAGLDKTQMTYTIDSIPILKQEIGDESKDECGTECGTGCGDESCCKEAFLVEYDMLEKLIESYDDIHDEFDAHSAICEHYSLDPASLTVVFESDYVAKGLVKDAKENTKNYGLMKSYSNTIKNMINKGITCCKKA